MARAHPGPSRRGKGPLRGPVVDPPTTIDVAAAVATARAGSRRFGPHDTVDPATVANIVLCFDQNLTSQAPVLIESMLANASGPAAPLGPRPRPQPRLRGLAGGRVPDRSR